MKKLLDGIYSWSVFNEDKGLNFNGHYLQTQPPVLVDPPLLAQADAEEIERLGRPEHIIITNRHHVRGALEAQQRFEAAIHMHALDAQEVDLEVASTFADGDSVCGLRVVTVPDSKSPGESALYWRERAVLIVGGALIGRPAGSLSLLPAEKFADVGKARAGLQVLTTLDVETVLVGDGESILVAGGAAIEKFMAFSG